MNKVKCSVFGLIITFLVIMNTSPVLASEKVNDVPFPDEQEFSANFDLTDPNPQEIEVEIDGETVVMGLELVDNDFVTPLARKIPNGNSTYRIYYTLGVINCQFYADIYVNPSTGRATIQAIYNSSVSGTGYTISNKKLQMIRKNETASLPARASLSFKATWFAFPYTIEPVLSMSIKGKVLTTKYEA